MERREQHWAALEARADALGSDEDPRDPRIDPKVKAAVVGLWAAGFPTVASCEGHAGGEGGCFPWIDVGTWIGYRTYRGDVSVSDVFHDALKRRLLTVLDEFYDSRRASYSVMLITGNLHPHVPFFSIFPHSGRVNAGRGEAEAARYLARYHEEVAAFGDFLKKRFFASRVTTDRAPRT